MQSLVTALLVVLACFAAFAQSPEFMRGDHVRILPRSKGPVPTIVLTVVAVPNDWVRSDGFTMYVNDIPVTAFPSEYLAQVAHVWLENPSLIRADSYLVMGYDIKHPTKENPQYSGDAY